MSSTDGLRPRFEAGLRAAQSVAGEGHDVDAGFGLLAAVGACGRPQVSTIARCRLQRSSISGRPWSRGRADRVRRRNRFGEAVDDVVRGMDMHDRRGIGPTAAA